MNTRAVLRQVQQGQEGRCAHCNQPLKFSARQKNYVVICNVYGSRPKRWLRVEQFHDTCYEEAGAPHGAADVSNTHRHFGGGRK